MKVRLVASDLDGTLLDPDGRLSLRTIAALQAAAAADITVIAATGRSFRTAGHRLRPAEVLRTMVCSNGALVYDLHDDRIDRMHTIAGDTLRHLFAALRTTHPQLRFGWETRDGFGVEADFGRKPGDSEHDSSLIGGPQHADQVDEAIKAFIAHPEVEQVELQRLIAPHLTAGLNGATSGARFVEVTAAGIDKGATVATIAEEWGVDQSEVVAIGDQMNDESMLRWAGTSVAMGNARPELKEFADVVAPPVSESGAAWAIERLAAGEGLQG